LGTDDRTTRVILHRVYLVIGCIVGPYDLGSRLWAEGEREGSRERGGPLPISLHKPYLLSCLIHRPRGEVWMFWCDPAEESPVLAYLVAGGPVYVYVNCRQPR
jgi:hypothetical protein